MWDATNSGTFTLSYNDGSFSAQGSFDSAGNFGEIGFERNGSFVEDERSGAGLRASKLSATSAALSSVQNQPNVALAQNAQGAQQPPGGPKFRGRIPVRELIH
jgi:hypothetical protein